MNNQPTLKRSLKVHNLVLFGLAWMTPMIFFTVYGVAYNAANGQMVLAYLVAFLAIFFTAYSYSRMVKVYPIAGSAYTYTKNAIHPRLGFIVGWALLLDYIFSPVIAILTFGIFMHTEFPSIPVYIWVVLMNVIIATVNIIGVKSVTRINTISVLIQILFISLFCLFTIQDILTSHSTSSTLFSLSPFLNSSETFTSVFAGAALICFCFLGFDAVTTMAEETFNPKKTIPKAIFFIVCIAAVMYVSISYFTQIAYPNFKFSSSDNASYQLIQLVGGNLLSSVFITVLIIATFTQGVSSVTSVTRFLYGLGRESILPQKTFSYLHPTLKTPVINVLLVTTFSFVGMVINLDTAVHFVSFGALISFAFVNISVIFHFYLKSKKRSIIETFLYLIFPLIGASFISWLLTLLNKETIIIGTGWIIIGVVYALVRARILKSKIERDNTKLTIGEKIN
jgi:putrescine importer